MTLVGLVLVAGCSVEKPKSPQFAVDFTIPLIDTTYTMADLIDENRDFLSASGEIAFFDVETPPELGIIGDALRVKPLPQNDGTEVGPFALDSPGHRFSEGFRLDVLAPGIAALEGQEVPVAPFAFDETHRDIAAYESFIAAVLSDRTEKDGATINTITVSLINDLPVPLENVELALVAEFAAEGVTGEIARFTFADPIPSRGEATQSLPIAGKRLSNTMNVIVAGGSPGSGGASVLINARDSFRIAAEISPLEAIQADGQVPPFRRPEEGVQDAVMSYPNDISVTEAVVESGTLTAVFGSAIRGLRGTRVFIGLPDFMDASGAPLPGQTIVLDEQASGSASFDVTGSIFRPRPSVDAPGEGKQDIRFAWSIESDGSGRVNIPLESRSRFDVALDASELLFSRVEGRVNRLPVVVPPQQRTLDLPDRLSNLMFENATLTMDVRSGIGLTSIVDLSLTGINERGETRTIEARSPIPRGNPEAPVPASIVFREGVVEFLNHLPQRIHTEGLLFVGDGSEESIVASDHFTEVMARLRAAMDFSLEQSEFRIGDVLADPDHPQQPLRIELDEQTRELIKDNVGDGAIVVKFVNRFPVGTKVSARFSADPEQLFVDLDRPELNLRPEVQTALIQIPAAGIDASGLVAAPTEGEDQVGIVKEDLDFFALNPVTFGAVRCIFDDTHGIVRVRTDHTLRFIAQLRLELLVNEDLFNEEGLFE
jgi:hypothetical protein